MIGQVFHNSVMFSTLYGARIYDARIGRLLSIDPRADDYAWQTHYAYHRNIPTNVIDYNGEGDYYTADGLWLGSDGIDDDKAYVTTYNANFMSSSCVQDGDKDVYTTDFSKLRNHDDTKLLTVKNSELLLLAKTAYGESSVGYGVENKEEVFGIASAIINNKNLRKNATIKSTIDGFAFAATDGNAQAQAFENASPSDRNSTFMQTAIAGAINAVEGGYDYSGGATHWDGMDLKTAKWDDAGGFKFTDASHDVLSLGDNNVLDIPKKTYWKMSDGSKGGQRGQYTHYWETTTVQFSENKSGKKIGTTFVKKSDDYVKAMGEPKY